MTRLKSWFIVPAITVSALLALVGAAGLIGAGAWMGWLGALLAALAFPLFIIYLMVWRPARTSARLPGLQALVGIGLAMAAIETARGGPPEALAVAVVATTLFGLYLYWYSTLERPPSPLLVGQPLPEFELRNPDGEVVCSAGLIGQPTVWLFYRGNWCPLCVAQVGELAARYREMAELGLKVVLISPQASDHTQRLAARFDAPMTFLVDPNADAARRLGLAADGGVPAGMGLLGHASDTVLPTLVLTDPDGVIVYLDQTDNYRLRPDPDAFLAIARQRLLID